MANAKNWFDIRSENTELSEHHLSANAHLVFLLLALFAGKNSECWPSESTLLYHTGLNDKRTIRKAITELEIAGFIRISKRKSGRNPNHYTLVLREKSTDKNGEFSSNAADNPYRKLLRYGNWDEIED